MSVLDNFRRLVIKIGSTLLVDETQQLNRLWLDSLSADIHGLQQSGHQVLVVSSGAVAIGSQVLGIDSRRSRLEELQAAAAAGQVQLVHAYQESLASFEISAAQVLLTPDDTEVKRRFLNARGTLEKLLEHKVVPIINENDTVATDELRYGDNDRLAARVAQTVMADCLVLLSDVDGFYTADPRQNADAEYLPTVSSITDEHLRMATDSSSELGSGGMRTKLLAAKIATHAGCATIVTDGTVQNPLHALAAGRRHSIFPAADSPAAARKQWLAGILTVKGELQVDNGAAEALQNGKSLLPVGVSVVEGSFDRGDAVIIRSVGGVELGRGLAAYSAREATAIIGCRSSEIAETLGYRGRSVMIHRDDMVLFGTKNQND